VSPRQYIHRADHIGIFLVATIHTRKQSLRLPALSCHVPTGRTGLAGVVRWYGNEYCASPVELVLKLAAKLEPALVEDGFVQPRLLRYVFTRCFSSAFARLTHMTHLQVLNSDHSVVFADLCCGFVQEVASSVTDTGVDFLNLPFGFLPVFAELNFATHLSLMAAQPSLMLFEAAKRRDEAGVAHGGEANNSHVDSNGTGGRKNGLLYFALSLDTCEPLVTRLTDSDVFCRTQNIPALPKAHLAQLGKFDAAVALVDFKALREPESITGALTFEPWEGCAFFKEALKGALQILERLLQRLGRGFVEPVKLFLPFWKAISHIHVAYELAACCVVCLLQRQGLVIDKPARPGKAAHVTLLFTIWHQLEFEGLQAFHFCFFRKSSIARRINSATESPVCFANSCSFAIDGSVR